MWYSIMEIPARYADIKLENHHKNTSDFQTVKIKSAKLLVKSSESKLSSFYLKDSEKSIKQAGEGFR